MYEVDFSIEESDKVENHQFLENSSMDFDKNQAAWSLLDTLSAENIKSAKIKIRKNRFFENFAYLQPRHVSRKNGNSHSRF